MNIDYVDEDISEEGLDDNLKTFINKADTATAPANVSHPARIQHGSILKKMKAKSTSESPLVSRKNPTFHLTPVFSPARTVFSTQSQSLWPLAQHEAALLTHYVSQFAPRVC